MVNQVQKFCCEIYLYRNLLELKEKNVVIDHKAIIQLQ